MSIDLHRIAAARQNIEKDFFYIDGIIDRLELFISLNETEPRTGNIIFFGPGGHGKTEIAEKYLTLATGAKPFVVNMNRATSFSDIAGGIDVPAFSRGDGINYMFDNSFMDYEYVIFEEGLEPLPRTLSALKYIISSGVFAAPGTQPRPIKTKGIIIVTNIDTSEFTGSDDTAAFLERFPLQYRVSWDRLNQHDRYQASTMVVKKFDSKGQLSAEQIKFIAENMASRKQSPRMVGRIVQALLALQALKGGGRINSEVFTQIAEMFGLVDTHLSDKIEQERIDKELREAKQTYQKTLETVRQHINQYLNLNADLADPKYILRIGEQIKSTMELLDTISNSVIDIRVDTRYGQKGDELASWINGQIGEMADDIDEVKRVTWNGMLKTISKLIRTCEQNSIKIG